MWVFLKISTISVQFLSIAIFLFIFSDIREDEVDDLGKISYMNLNDLNVAP